MQTGRIFKHFDKTKIHCYFKDVQATDLFIKSIVICVIFVGSFNRHDSRKPNLRIDWPQMSFGYGCRNCGKVLFHLSHSWPYQRGKNFAIML